MRDAVVIPSQFNGPPSVANGGYTAGLLAEGIRGPVTVRIDAPVPLDTSLELRQTPGERVLAQHGRRLAVARRGTLPAVDLAPSTLDAALASPTMPPDLNPFPSCFVCGASRRDGMALVPRRGPDGTIVAVFEPSRLVDPTEPVPLRLLWSALDCPSGFALVESLGSGVLGTLNAAIYEQPAADSPLVVVAAGRGVDGRKADAVSAIFDHAGRLVAAAEATWIAIDRTAAVATSDRSGNS